MVFYFFYNHSHISIHLQLVALKILPRGETLDEKFVFREIVIQSTLAHIHIVKLKEVLLTHSHLILKLEYAAGGECRSRFFALFFFPWSMRIIDCDLFFLYFSCIFFNLQCNNNSKPMKTCMIIYLSISQASCINTLRNKSPRDRTSC